MRYPRLDVRGLDRQAGTRHVRDRELRRAPYARLELPEVVELVVDVAPDHLAWGPVLATVRSLERAETREGRDALQRPRADELEPLPRVGLVTTAGGPNGFRIQLEPRAVEPARQVERPRHDRPGTVGRRHLDADARAQDGPPRAGSGTRSP